MNDNELTNWVVIDIKTGEMVQGITKKEQKYLYRNYTTANSKINDKENKGLNKNEFNNSLKLMCGSFYFNFYNNKIDNKYAFRFIYLCTFCNYKNYLEFGNQKEEKKLITKKDMFEILKLSSKETYRTIDYFIENNMIIFDKENNIKINEAYSKRGEIDNNKKGVVRMFDKAIREIYEKSLPREHKKLGLLISLLPMVNYGWNVLCKNPEETNAQNIIPYNLTDVAKLLDYSSTQKFKKGLIDLTVNKEKVIMLCTIGNKTMIVINPRIYYKGNETTNKAFQYIIGQFDMAKNM